MTGRVGAAAPGAPRRGGSTGGPATHHTGSREFPPLDLVRLDPLEVIEVQGADGAPPYRVRYPDGHETVVFPGPDSTVEHVEEAQQG